MDDTINVNVIAGELIENLIRAFSDDAIVAMLGQEWFGWVAFRVFLQCFNRIENAGNNFQDHLCRGIFGQYLRISRKSRPA